MFKANEIPLRKKYKFNLKINQSFLKESAD